MKGRVGKRIVSIVVSIFLVVGMIVASPSQMVYAATYNGKANGKDLKTILNSISGYCITSGSYKCTAKVGSGTHYCCYNFATIAYKKIWGESFSKTSKNNYLNSVAANDRKLTVANLKKYLSKTTPGAMIRIDNSAGLSSADNDGHSMIFCGMNNSGDGAYFLQANYDGKGTKQLSEIKFNSLLSGYYGRYKYIKYIIWPNGSAAQPTNRLPVMNLEVAATSENNRSIRIAGWAYDPDSPNVSVDIHVYVGGPAGSSTGKMCAYFKADINRQDVNQAFGISGNHGFDYEITFDTGGTKKIYIYVIDVNDNYQHTSWPETSVHAHELISTGVHISCTQDCTYGTYCRCGYRKETITKATGHRWDAGTITKAATCTEKGIKTYKCQWSWCYDTKTEEIPATGHSWDSGKITKQPTTTSTGVKTYTCTKCGTTKNETVDKLKEQKKAGVAYTTHIQSIGWQGVVRDGNLAGTVGDGKRLEAIKISFENAPYSGNIEYRTHVQTYGWQGWVRNGAVSGTSGQAKRLEAIQIRLTGEMAKHYDVYYRIQVQSYGWLGWAKNGEYSGSAGYGKRLEAIQIVLVEKGKTIDRTTLNKQAKITSSTKVTDSTPYIAKAPSVEYQTHVQTYGWQGLKINGEVSGTIGKAKRLEGIKINLSKPPYDGGIRYKTHIQSIGWQDWKNDGAMSGTSGQSKRLEAICIELTGEMAKHYDVYYRVHAQSYGWLGWAKNGQNAGTAGYAKRLEGIQIVLVEKGKAGPGATYKGITADRTEAYISK